MFCHLHAYWIMVSARCWLCFHRGWGAFGLWAGLSLALILIGIVLLFAWDARFAIRCIILSSNCSLSIERETELSY